MQDSGVSNAPGNTVTGAPIRSRKWFLTFNNPTESEINEFIESLDENEKTRYVIQKEAGSMHGTPHLQGCVWYQNAKTLSALKRVNTRIHWEVCKDWKAACKYCSKTNGRIEGPWTKNVTLLDCLKTLQDDQLYDWQRAVLSCIKDEPDDRTIHWIWEPKGCTGKTQFCKYLAIKHQALILGGRAADMFYAISQVMKNGKAPRLIVLDIPRSVEKDLSYEGIEKVKDGMFFSSKYESGQVLFDSPHVFIFSNFYPDMNTLSEDRWDIVQINNN